MQRLHANGYDFACVEQGSGELVLLVHGSLNDHRYWAPQMAPFAAAGFRAVAVSLRHCWPERWDGEGEGYGVDGQVADLAAIIPALGAQAAHVVGHSRGGHLAFRLAGRHPALVRRLVLAEPGGTLDASLGGTGEPAVTAPYMAEALALLRAGDAEGALRRFAEHTGGPGAWDRRSAERQAIGRDNVMTLLGQVREGRRPYARAEAAAIRMPTLLVGGARTQPVFNAILDALEGAIPGTRRVTIPDATHAMSRDNPAAFDAAVLDFLRAA